MMKTLPIALAVLSTTAFSQVSDKAGVVRYESVRKLEIRLADDDEVAGMLPRELKTVKELFFTSGQALFRAADEQTEAEAFRESAGGNEIVIRIKEPELIIYSDLNSRINTEQREFMSRYFLIETPTDTARWKLTGNSKKILDYNCLEAELQGSHAVAWFAPDLNVSCGPEGYCGLPGLILALEVGEGERSYNAITVELKDPGTLARPDQGRKVSRREFDTLVAEKEKEMEESGNKGVFIRRIEEDTK
jgi:GLPGLI family protein